MAQQQNRPSSGDMTGRQKVQQSKEARLADQDRAAEMSMATAVQTDEELHGTFDAQSGDRIDAPAAHTAVEVEPEPQGFFRPDNEPTLTGQEDPEVVAPIIAARKAVVAQPPVEVVKSSHVEIRVDSDIDDMTYGMRNGEPNNFTFKEGLKYRVPLAVAEHLNDRGLIRSWGPR